MNGKVLEKTIQRDPAGRIARILEREVDPARPAADWIIVDMYALRVLESLASPEVLARSDVVTVTPHVRWSLHEPIDELDEKIAARLKASPAYAALEAQARWEAVEISWPPETE